MDDEWNYPAQGDRDSAAELEGLHRIRTELWTAFRREDDPERRRELLSRLSENRASILNLGDQKGFEAPEPSAAPTVQAGTPSPGRVDDTQPRPESRQQQQQALPQQQVSPPPQEFETQTRDRGFNRETNGSDPSWPAPAQTTGGFSQTGDFEPQADERTYNFNAGQRPDVQRPNGRQEAMSPPRSNLGQDLGPPPNEQRPQQHEQPPRERQLPPMGNGHNAMDGMQTTHPGGNFNGGGKGRILTLVLGLVAVLGLAFVAIQYLDRDNGPGVAATDEGAAEDAAGPETNDPLVTQIAAVASGMGFPGVIVERADGQIKLSGNIPSEADAASLMGAIQGLAGSTPIDRTALIVGQAGASDPATVAERSEAELLQSDIDRIVDATPIIFEPNQTDLTDIHKRVLDNVVQTLNAQPTGPTVNVVGRTDKSGSDEANKALSLARAQAVKDYLVAAGVPDARLVVQARGEDAASGSAGLQNLERRVEFEVEKAAAASGGALKVALVAPSARNDAAFTQSMFDAINTVNEERGGGMTIEITDNTFVEAEAAAAIRGYAEADFDLVIAHGSQYGASVSEIAREFPNVVFAWGTASDSFGLPNVYPYDVSTEQGGYVLGAVASLLSGNKALGIVGPIEIGDAKRYVDGFTQGAKAETAESRVDVNYIGSFSDAGLANEAAQAHVGNGVDVLTGTAQMVTGAIQVAQENNILWFGSQSNQTLLAPNLVVASQVYHWEVILREMIADIEAGAVNARAFNANLANGGIVIEYNEGYALPAEVKARADELVAGLSAGTITISGY